MVIPSPFFDAQSTDGETAGQTHLFSTQIVVHLLSSLASASHGTHHQRSTRSGISGDEHIVGKLLTTFYDNIA